MHPVLGVKSNIGMEFGRKTSGICVFLIAFSVAFRPVWSGLLS